MRPLASKLDSEGRTSLHLLALNTKKCAVDVISDCNKLISFGMDVNAQDHCEFGLPSPYQGITRKILVWICRFKKSERFRNYPDGNTALNYACRNARSSFVQRLLEAGADPDITNEVCCRIQSPNYVWFGAETYSKMSQIQSYMTALHEAAQHFDDYSIEVLLAHPMYKEKVIDSEWYR